MRKQSPRSSQNPLRAADGAHSPVRMARAEAVLLYLEKHVTLFLTPEHLPAFVANGWSQQQVEIALNDLALAGSVEISAHLDAYSAVFLMARLKDGGAEHES